MSDDKPSSTQRTVVNNSPWGPSQDYLKRGFQRAEGLLQNPRKYYPNSTVVPQHSATTTALDKIRQRALEGSPLHRAGNDTILGAARGDLRGTNPASGTFDDIAGGRTASQQELLKTATGGYMGKNPYLQKLIDQSIGSARAATDAQFSGRGRYGSGLHKGMAEDRAANIATSVLAPAYETERSRMGAAASQLLNSRLSGAKGYSDIFGSETDDMLSAAKLAPGMAQFDYGDYDKLGSVGAAFEAQGQAELQDKIRRYNYNQDAPRDALADFMALIGGGQQGGSRTTDQPIYSDPFGKYLGYAGTAANIYSAFA